MSKGIFYRWPRLSLWVCYTLIFALTVRAIGYTLPFVISLVIAVIMKPLYDYLRRRFAFRSSFAATTLTLLIFGVLFAVVGFLLYLVAVQALSLYDTYGYLLRDYLSMGSIVSKLRDGLLSGGWLQTVSEVAVSLFRAVPMTVTFVVITFAMTVFLLHHLGAIKDGILRFLPADNRQVVSSVFSTAYIMVRRFIRSYMVLYVITFVEAVFIFYLTGVPYPLPFAFVTAVADILPVLGPGTVYIPFAAIFILEKNYLQGITLLVFFLITVILRQILEPRIVSDTVKVHPLVIMSAIYFSIVSMNIWVLFYIVLLFLIYKVLVIAGVFDYLSQRAD